MHNDNEAVIQRSRWCHGWIKGIQLCLRVSGMITKGHPGGTGWKGHHRRVYATLCSWVSIQAFQVYDRWLPNSQYISFIPSLYSPQKEKDLGSFKEIDLGTSEFQMLSLPSYIYTSYTNPWKYSISYYCNAVIDHSVEGDHEFLRILLYLLHTLRTQLVKLMRASWAHPFRTETFKMRHVASPVSYERHDSSVLRWQMV